MQDYKTKAQKKMVYRGVNGVVRDNTTRYNFFRDVFYGKFSTLRV